MTVGNSPELNGFMNILKHNGDYLKNICLKRKDIVFRTTNISLIVPYQKILIRSIIYLRLNKEMKICKMNYA